MFLEFKHFKKLKLALLLIKTSAVVSDWRIVSDPKHAGWLFSQELLHRYKDSRSLSLSLDLRQSREEQDQALVSFYKSDGAQWAAPLTCMLKGRLKTPVWISNTISSVDEKNLLLYRWCRNREWSRPPHHLNNDFKAYEWTSNKFR